MTLAAMSAGTFIHPSAVVEPGARLGAGVRIGPLCHVGAEVELGDGVELFGHVSVTGATTVGAGTRIHAQAALGGPPQDAKHKGGRTTLTIGRDCLIREGVTMNAGSDRDKGATTVGDNCTFLAYTHVAHDCIVGDYVTMTNGAVMGGHCHIGDHVIIGGLTAVHQFTRVGRRAFLGGMTAVIGDVIPYGIVSGNPARLRGLNIIGLKRAGMSRDDLFTLRAAWRVLFSEERPLAENVGIARRDFAGSAVAMEVVDFLDHRGKRQFITPRSGGDGAADDGGD